MKLTIIIAILVLSFSLFSQEKEENFTLCDSIGLWPYYNPTLKYQGGFWEIKQQFKTTCPTNKFKNLKNNTGMVTIQFKVNCKGEIGNFKLQQCDLNYQPTLLDKKITTYLLSQTKQLKNWIPAIDEDRNTVNSHKFLSFKLKEGVLLEILPK